jgi:hypothetical protein
LHPVVSLLSFAWVSDLFGLTKGPTGSAFLALADLFLELVIGVEMAASSEKGEASGTSLEAGREQTLEELCASI